MSPPLPNPSRLAPLVGAYATLVLSVAVLLSVEQIRPVMRELQRETATERAAVRQLAGHLARAVRGLAGTGAHAAVPAADTPRAWTQVSGVTPRACPAGADLPRELCRPRDALLNLPPPTRAA